MAAQALSHVGGRSSRAVIEQIGIADVMSAKSSNCILASMTSYSLSLAFAHYVC